MKDNLADRTVEIFGRLCKSLRKRKLNVFVVPLAVLLLAIALILGGYQLKEKEPTKNGA